MVTRSSLRRKSTLLGPCIVIPQEYPNIRIKSIDLELPGPDQIDDLTIDRNFGEFFKSDSELSVAYGIPTLDPDI